jgi:hypothetical protein
MVPLEVDDAIEVEDLEEVEAQAVGVGHRKDREDNEQLESLTLITIPISSLFGRSLGNARRLSSSGRGRSKGAG